MSNNNNIYPGYTAMTEADANRMIAANKKAGWGFTIDNLVRLIRKHKKASECGDVRTMEMIEFRLDDCNFHTEAGFISEGLYDKAIKSARR